MKCKRNGDGKMPDKTKDKLLFSLMLFLFSGILLGALSVGRVSEKLLAALWHGAEQTSVWAHFFSVLSSDVLLLAALFVLGLGCAAPVFVFPMMLFHGLGLGVTGAYLCRAGESVLSEFLKLSAGAAGTCFVLLYAGKEALLMSCAFLKVAGKTGSGENFSGRVKKYCLKFLVFAVILLINALFDTMLSVLAGKTA